MSREIKVAAAQMGPNGNEKEWNVRRMTNLMEDALRIGASIVCFPELAFSTYFPKNEPPEDKQEFEQWFNLIPDHLTRELLAKSKEGRIAVILPYAEKAEKEYYNSAVVVGRNGEHLGKYRKIHVPQPREWSPGKPALFENQWFREGNVGFPVFHVDDVTFGVLICYDRHFPEPFRCLALEGADIIFLCTNSPSYGDYAKWRAETHDMILQTRAYENTVFVIGAEKAGMEEGVEWLGRTMIVSPNAEILAKAVFHDRDELVWATIDLDLIEQVRKTRPFLSERKPKHYKKLLD